MRFSRIWENIVEWLTGKPTFGNGKKVNVSLILIYSSGGTHTVNLIFDSVKVAAPVISRISTWFFNGNDPMLSLGVGNHVVIISRKDLTGIEILG